MSKILWLLALLLCPLSLLAETIEGRLDSVYLNGNTVKVNGVTYTANMEATRVFYQGQFVGEESLTPGDDVQLIFSDEQASGMLRKLEMIILVRGSKQGLDS